MKIRIIILLLALSISLMGCGGGGDGSSNDSSSVSFTISGAAVTGIIKNGIVTAYEFTDGEVGAKLGSTTTNQNGTYTLVLDENYDKEKPLLLELTVTFETKIVCDAQYGCLGVKRGEIYSPSTDFKMTSILPADAGTNINAQITPFTNMATEYFKEQTDEGVDAAVNRVNQLIGVNILNVQPVDITANEVDGSVDQQKYALMLAALATISFGDGSSSITITNAEKKIEEFSNDFKDGILGDGESQDTSTGILNPVEFIEKIRIEVNSTKNEKIHPNALNDAEAIAKLLELQLKGGKFYTEKPTEGSINKDKVVKAKELIADIRNWAGSLNDLQDPTVMFGENLGNVLNDSTNDVLENTVFVISSFVEAIRTTGINSGDSIKIKGDEYHSYYDDDKGYYDYDRRDLGNATVTITTQSDTIGTTITYSISALDINGVVVELDLKLNYPIKISDESVILEKDKSIYEVIGNAKSTDAKIALNGKVMVNLNEDIVTDEFEVENDLDDFKSFILSDGSILMEILSGDSEGKKVESDINLSIINKQGKDNLISKVELSNLKLLDSNGSSSALNISLELDSIAILDIDTILDTNIIDTIRANNEQDIDNNYMKVDFNVNGKLNLVNKPQVIVSLMANQEKSGESSTTLFISYDSKNIKIEANGKDKLWTGSVSNYNGEKMDIRIDENGLLGKILVDGKIVGNIEENTNGLLLIRYNDGSFESF